jgi:hypothetical protein
MSQLEVFALQKLHKFVTAALHGGPGSAGQRRPWRPSVQFHGFGVLQIYGLEFRYAKRRIYAGCN